MPAGGTWVAQNKIRPGAYINFKYNARNGGTLSLGTRGTIAVATDLPWGPDNTLIEVSAQDFASGKSASQIGIVGDSSEASLPLRLALAGANKALVYKLNPGGEKASAKLGEITVTAKYPGAYGNTISFDIKNDTPSVGQTQVNIYLAGVRKETFNLASINDILTIESQYVDFGGQVDFVQTWSNHDGAKTDYVLTYAAKDDKLIKLVLGANIDADLSPDTRDVTKVLALTTHYTVTGTTLTLTAEGAALATGVGLHARYIPAENTWLATAGTTLSGGTNGTEAKDLTDFFAAIEHKTFNAVAANKEDAADVIIAFVKDQRENKGKKFVGVVVDKETADYEGIISVNQGFKSETETVTPTLFSIYVASLSAGAMVNESLTCRQIVEAVEIINPLEEDKIEEALQQGKFVLSYRQDGAVIIEKDINTLVTFDEDKGYPFSKNRVIRVLDEIANQVALKFNSNYAGKVTNDDEGRKLFKSEIINLMDTLQGLGAIQNFLSEDVTVLPGDDIESVLVDLNVQPTDAMEKLYMTVYVTA